MAQDSQYQETFVHFLTEIPQERTDIILQDVNVWEDYGIGRSLLRGAEVRVGGSLRLDTYPNPAKYIKKNP